MELLRKGFKQVLDIRKEEFLRTLLMFFYLFLVIACQVTAKSVRDSLFLKRIGYSALPFVYILIALGSGAVSSLYSRAAARLNLLQLIRASLLIAIAVFCLFRLGTGSSGGWLYYLLYMWVSVFGLLAASQCWLLANYIFNAREAKRLFGVIGAGGVLGGIIGGLFTSYGAHRFGTENLLWCCMGLLALTLLIVESISAKTSIRTEMGFQPPRVRMEPPQTWKMVKLIRESRHLRLMTTILAIGVICEAFVDYQIKYVSTHSFGSRDQLTAFFGNLQVYLGTFAFLFQLFCTARILKRFGVGTSLFFQPIAMLAGSLFLAASPTVFAAGFLRVSDGTFRYSIHRAGTELLYLPIPFRIKNRVKGFLDVFVDRLGGGVAGLVLILLANQLKWGIPHLSLLVCGMIGVLLYLTVQMKKEYLNSFRLALERKSIEPDTLSFPFFDGATLRHLLEVLDGDDERQVLYAIKLLEDAPPELWFPKLEPLLKHDSTKVRAAVLEQLSSRPEAHKRESVERCLKDPELSVRVEAIHYLVALATGTIEERLKPYLRNPDFSVVAAAVQYVAQYEENPHHLIDQELIIQAMAEKGAQRKEARIAAATALGLLETETILHASLISLLEDASADVIRPAIQTCGKVRSRQAIPQLIAMLSRQHCRLELRESLARYGNSVVNELCAAMTGGSHPVAIRTNIPSVLSRIGTQEAVDGLLQTLPGSDHFLGYRIIKALNKMRDKHPDLQFAGQLIDSLILEEVNAYYQFVQMLCSKELKQPDLFGSSRLLRKALVERMDLKIERVFRLLHLRYSSRDIYFAYSGITSKKPAVRANAIEFLDNLLQPHIKQALLPILEEISLESLLANQKSQLLSQQENQVAVLRGLLGGRDEWLKAIALYVTGTLRLRELLPEVRTTANHSSSFVLETANWCIVSLAGELSLPETS